MSVYFKSKSCCRIFLSSLRVACQICYLEVLCSNPPIVNTLWIQIPIFTSNWEIYMYRYCRACSAVCFELKQHQADMNVSGLEQVIRSELTLQKGWVILANEGHSQYCEWQLLARITQRFYIVNSLLITHLSLVTCSDVKIKRLSNPFVVLYNFSLMVTHGNTFFNTFASKQLFIRHKSVTICNNRSIILDMGKVSAQRCN